MTWSATSYEGDRGSLALMMKATDIRTAVRDDAGCAICDEKAWNAIEDGDQGLGAGPSWPTRGHAGKYRRAVSCEQVFLLHSEESELVSSPHRKNGQKSAKRSGRGV